MKNNETAIQIKFLILVRIFENGWISLSPLAVPHLKFSTSLHHM